MIVFQTTITSLMLLATEIVLLQSAISLRNSPFTVKSYFTYSLLTTPVFSLNTSDENSKIEEKVVFRTLSDI